MSELLIGCGHKETWRKQLTLIGSEGWTDLTTLDIDLSLGADVIHDLNDLPYPFEDNQFDEVHAYEVLEHVGRQGDWKFFLDQFSEFWRILKPGGHFFASCPHYKSMWAWGDPGHTRVISPASLFFLSYPNYEANEKAVTHMTDYRSWYRADFEAVMLKVREDETFYFILKTHKPGRDTPPR